MSKGFFIPGTRRLRFHGMQLHFSVSGFCVTQHPCVAKIWNMDVRQDASLFAAIHQRVEIQPYDVRWPSRFECERVRLIQQFQEEFLAIEHFGSTAVHGLAAKPIIDILAGVESIRAADELLPRLCQAAYDTSEEFNATLKDRRWLMRHEDGKRTHHLHLVIYG